MQVNTLENNHIKYSKPAVNARLVKTVAELEAKGIETYIVSNAREALVKIKKLIPKNASVMNGSSKTLEEIGFVDYLKSGRHGWNNLHEAIVNESDPKEKSRLRKEAVLADYYLGSVHALTENGDFIVASNTGSQLAHIVYTSPNLIFVVGAQKIVGDLEGAKRRLDEYVVPLEDENMNQKYGMGTKLNKIVIFRGESEFTGRKIRMILVREKLGF